MKPKKDKEGGSSSKSIGSLNKKVAERNCNGDVFNVNNTEDVEEGELGILPIENGKFVPEKPVRRYGMKSEIEKGEFIPGRWQKSDGELGRREWKSSKNELEKGEFVPDRWCRSEIGDKTDEYGYSKARRYKTAKEKGWKYEHEWASHSAKERGWKFDRDTEWTSPSGREKVWKADLEWSPPSGKDKGWKGNREPERTPPSSGKYSSEKELSRSGGSSRHLKKLSSRYEPEKTVKTSSKVAGDEGSPLKHDLSNGKNHTRDYSQSNRLKKHGNDPDSNDRKYRAGYDEYSKNRKFSDDRCHSAFSSDHSGRYVERPYKTAAISSSRNIPSERYSSRHLESSRAVYDMPNNSPHHFEWSPHDRARNSDHRNRGPARHDRSPYERSKLYDRSGSPYDRSRHHDNKYRRPSYVERSPRDKGRNHYDKDRTPTLLERSPLDRGRYSDHRETKRISGVGDKWPIHCGSKGQEAKNNLKDSGGRESQILAKESQDKGNLDNGNGSINKTASLLCNHEELSQTPTFKSVESSQENGVTEDPASMEEDMDICNTPPHVPVVADSTAGKWYHLDHFGVERGPSKLSDLKRLVEEGYLVSDHLIKRLDTDRWVTVENANSPLLTVKPSVVPETVTQLVCPPEAPGNLLADNGNRASDNLTGEEMLTPSSHPLFCSDDNAAASKSVVHLHIDERVESLLEGVTLVPGRELEMVTGMRIYICGLFHLSFVP